MKDAHFFNPKKKQAQFYTGDWLSNLTDEQLGELTHQIRQVIHAKPNIELPYEVFKIIETLLSLEKIGETMVTLNTDEVHEKLNVLKCFCALVYLERQELVVIIQNMSLSSESIKYQVTEKGMHSDELRLLLNS